MSRGMTHVLNRTGGIGMPFTSVAAQQEPKL